MGILENKELVRRQIEEVWNQHNFEKLGEFVSSDLLEEGGGHVEQFLAAFPDSHTIIEDLIGEDEKVVGRLLVSGTNTGPFAGQPPTGKKVEFRSIRIYRIAGGKIVETWAMQDRLGLMEQLGLVQSAAGNVDWAGGEED
jgi:predicted ester cyclase